jgi:beta-lactamase regulating signal transducer with metallopeptidase domain
MLAAVLPAWRILPRMDSESIAPAAPDAAPIASAEASSDVASGALAPAMPNLLPSSLNINMPPSTIEPQPANPGPMRSIAAPQIRPMPWARWMFYVWLVGMFVAMAPVFLGYLSLWLLQRRCANVDDAGWNRLLETLRAELQIRRPVQLLSSPLRTMPMTWGLLRSRLLVPEEAMHWPTQQRRSVLLHELGHVRRFDCLTQLLAQLACAAYWFNPLVWYAWRRMQVERERACDDLVLRSGATASSYASNLLHSAAATPPLRFIGAAVAMARPSTLEERLRAILDSQKNRRPMSRAMVVATMLLLMAALLPMAALQAQETPADIPPAAPSAPAAPAAPATAAAPNDAAEPASTGSIEERMRAARIRAGAYGNAAILPVRAASQGPTCPLDAMIYDVRIPVDRIGRIDMEALMRSAAVTGESQRPAVLNILQEDLRAKKAEQAMLENRLLAFEQAHPGMKLDAIQQERLRTLAAAYTQAQLDTITLRSNPQMGQGRPELQAALAKEEALYGEYQAELTRAMKANVEQADYAKLKTELDATKQLTSALQARVKDFENAPPDFEAALAALGTVRPLYRVNQSVRLGGDSITVGSNAPYVSNSQTTRGGQTINSVQYSNTGAVFNIAGKAAGDSRIELDLSIDLSAASDTTTEISPTVKAQMVRRATMSYKGVVEPRQPFVVLSVDAASVDAEGRAVAYIARVRLGNPQQSADPQPQ